MQTKQQHTVVIIPNNSRLEVSYYCTDKKVLENEKKDFTNLIIQLHDCHSSIKISKSKIKTSGQLEMIVQNMVVNARGHLCD